MKKFLFLSSCLTQEDEDEDANEKEEFFVRNGGLLLEKLISICHGSHNPFRTFLAKDLKKATNNYDSSLIFHQTYQCKWYKGSLEGRQVSVRKTEYRNSWNGKDLKRTINQIAMSIKMSNHNGALKLLGCSLETEFPILVYEFPTHECLVDLLIMPSDNGRDSQAALTWKMRLKIAFEIAHFISYLHTAFPRPVLHRKINLSNFFLDQNFVPKESNFSGSVILPDDQDYVSDDGSYDTVTTVPPESVNYRGPEFFRTARFTEKTDIFGFGVLLHQLLTGKKARIDRDSFMHVVLYVQSCVKIHGIDGIMDPNIRDEVEGSGTTSLGRQQFQAVYCLAQRCVTKAAGHRPTITEVAKELKQIQRGLFEGDYVPIKPLFSDDDAAGSLMSFSSIRDIEGEDDAAGSLMSFSSNRDDAAGSLMSFSSNRDIEGEDDAAGSLISFSSIRDIEGEGEDIEGRD